MESPVDLSEKGSTPDSEGVPGSRRFPLQQRGPAEQLRQQLYGDVPLQRQVNVPNLGDPTTWPAINNPFGLAANSPHPLEYQHVVWYYATQGASDDYDKATLDSLMMRDSATYRDQWHPAYSEFGPNGSLVAQWGQIPNYP